MTSAVTTGLLFALASMLLRKAKSLGFFHDEWVETAQLLGGESSDRRDAVVAIDNGILAVVTDREHRSPGDPPFVVSVFERVDGEWSPKQTLMATDSEDFSFGCSIVISDGSIMVGATRDYDMTLAAGSVFVYSKDEVGGSWTQQAKLLPHDIARNVNFGRNLAMHKNTLLVAAARPHNYRTEKRDSAYVYSFLDGVWTEHAKLLPSDGSAQDVFGWSVAIRDETLLVGSSKKTGSGSGSVYIFQLQDGRWTEQAQLVQQHLTGYGVALERGTVFTSFSNVEGGSDGVNVFRQEGSSWVQQTTLVPSDSTSYCASPLAVQNGLLVVGSAGAVYLFEESIFGYWTARAKLVASDVATAHAFSNSVDLDDGVVVVAGSCVGCPAYVFERRNLSGPNTRLVGAALLLSFILASWARARRAHPRDRNV